MILIIFIYLARWNKNIKMLIVNNILQIKNNVNKRSSNLKVQ